MVGPLSGGVLAATASTLAAISPALRDGAPSSVAGMPPALLAALSAPRDVIIEGRIEKGDTLIKSLSKNGVAAKTAALIQREMRPKFDFRRTRAGQTYRVTLSPRGALTSFHYSASKTEHYWLERIGRSWRVWREEADVRREQRKVAGVVSTSLTDAIEDRVGEANQRLAQDFAGIFAWDLDFSRGIQEGDRFRMLYERTFAAQGKGRERNLGPGRILAAQYHGAGGEMAAIYFETEPGRGGYYRPDGTLGYPGYKVADHVQQHSLWGAGVYCFNRNNPSIVTQNGYEVPRGPGISLVHVMTKNLSGPGIINAVVNGVGARVDGVPDPGDPDNYEDPSYVIRYP